MDALTKNVVATIGLKPETARAAIVHVLLFLHDEMPEGHFGEFIDGMQEAREAVDAARAARVSAVPAAVEGLASVMGRGGGPNISLLAGNLMSLGLDESQVIGLMNAVIARAETLTGNDNAAMIRKILPALAASFGHTTAPMQSGE